MLSIIWKIQAHFTVSQNYYFQYFSKIATDFNTLQILNLKSSGGFEKFYKTGASKVWLGFTMSKAK